MNETIVAKGLTKYLAEKYRGFGGDGLVVMNKAETKEHGYTYGCATILSSETMYDEHNAPWTYDYSEELRNWVKAKYGNEYWLEPYNEYILCVNKDTGE